MPPVKRILSSLLLAAGMLLVFTGLTAALGFTVPGMIASIGVMAALLYAGGVWFGPGAATAPAGAPASVVLFDRDLHIAAGPGAGFPLLARYPAALRPELEVRCRAALRGESTRFVCQIGGSRVVFEIAPIASATGIVVYGTLITTTGLSIPNVAPQPLTTVA
jgi:hypothetical protein